ncbi:MAG: hypothetical protein JKY50_19245 [Oleispira sp.]|nr:hypothetical protein [Oleispira sp.]
MNFNKYFRIALFLPYIFPAFLLAVNFAFELPEILQATSVFILLPSILGGIPYTIFVYFAFTWSKFRSEREIKKWMWKAPLFFLPLLTLMLILMFPTSNFDGAIKTFGLITIIVLAYGYFYVFLAHCGWVIVKKLGWDKECSMSL